MRFGIALAAMTCAALARAEEPVWSFFKTTASNSDVQSVACALRPRTSISGRDQPIAIRVERDGETTSCPAPEGALFPITVRIRAGGVIVAADPASELRAPASLVVSDVAHEIDRLLKLAAPKETEPSIPAGDPNELMGKIRSNATSESIVRTLEGAIGVPIGLGFMAFGPTYLAAASQREGGIGASAFQSILGAITITGYGAAITGISLMWLATRSPLSRIARDYSGLVENETLAPATRFRILADELRHSANVAKDMRQIYGGMMLIPAGAAAVTASLFLPFVPAIRDERSRNEVLAISTSLLGGGILLGALGLYTLLAKTPVERLYEDLRRRSAPPRVGE